MFRFKDIIYDTIDLAGKYRVNCIISDDNDNDIVISLKFHKKIDYDELEKYVNNEICKQYNIKEQETIDKRIKDIEQELIMLTSMQAQLLDEKAKLEDQINAITDAKRNIIDGL